MTIRSVLPLMLAVTIAGACTAEPAPEPEPVADTQADADAIRALADQELALATAGDAVGFGALLTADAIAMPPNEPAVTGAAVQEWLQNFMAAVTLSGARYQHDEIRVHGDVAIHRFSFTWTMTPKAGGEPVTETGKGIHIMIRQPDGSWKIARDVWNTDAPAPSM